MKRTSLAVLAVAAVFGFSGCSDVSVPSGGPEQYAYGTCKLTNLAENIVLYSGGCSIRQSRSGANEVIDVKLGSAQSFVFAGHGSNWMHGSQRVRYTDLGGGAIFVWDKFSLSAAVR